MLKEMANRLTRPELEKAVVNYMLIVQSRVDNLSISRLTQLGVVLEDIIKKEVEDADTSSAGVG